MKVFSGTNWPAWFAQMWPRQARAVMADCLTIGVQHPHFLADLALRGNVYAPILDNDPVAAARAEGRRQLALETIKLCNIDPDKMWSMLDPLPHHKREDSR